MPTQRLFRHGFITLSIGCVAWSCLTAPALTKEPAVLTALDQYVNQPDDSYSWRIINEEKVDGGKIIWVDMVSQTWRTKDDVDRPEWQHWLTVTIPDEVRSEIGMLLIGGGANGREPPNEPSEIGHQVALATGSIVAELSMVPNQPLVFHQDGEKRTEDDLIGYTWAQYLKTGDATWPARNPMVKSAVRAMDTMTSLAASPEGGELTLDKFVVAGGSKRGWTTWLTGAVDDRVVGIVPIVIDVLNVKECTKHHFAAYGFWAPAIGDYVEHGFTQQMDHPRLPDLYALVDPLYYRDRLKMPKYIVNASGDQFFPPDSSQYYFDELLGEKHLRYVPNAEHSLKGTDAVQSVTAYYSLILAGSELPQFTWQHEDDGSLRVTPDDQPSEVRLWQATNESARDFRVEALGRKYTSTILEPQSDGSYLAHVPTPADGWTAYFVELAYDQGDGPALKVTTNVKVLPDVFPFADKNPGLPPTITVDFVAPNQQVVEKISQVAASIESTPLAAVTDELRLAVGGSDGQAGAEGLALNWTPKGRFEKGGRMLMGWLQEQGCRDFTIRFDSGPRFEEVTTGVPAAE